MYGYLRPDNSVLDFPVRRYYRERYCSLCHALWNDYGMLPRMLLSYDVTFAAIILDLDSQVDFNTNKLLCYRKNKIRSQHEQWNALASISILLAAGKLKDNIADDRSMLARILLALYARPIGKAKARHPQLADFLDSGLARMAQLEREKASLHQLSDAFAEMMCGAYELMVDSSPTQLAIVRHVSKWVYFIDAVDDLDKDIKRDRYNPLRLIAGSKQDLTENHSGFIAQFVSDQREELLPHKEGFSGSGLSHRMMRSILNDTIPEVTKRVLLNQPVSRYTSPHLRVIQAKEGIIFD